MLEVTIHNARYLYNKANNPIKQLDFRRNIAYTYLSRYGVKLKGSGRPSALFRNPGNPEDVRYDQIDHFLIYVPNKKEDKMWPMHRL